MVVVVLITIFTTEDSVIFWHSPNVGARTKIFVREQIVLSNNILITPDA